MEEGLGHRPVRTGRRRLCRLEHAYASVRDPVSRGSEWRSDHSQAPAATSDEVEWWRDPC